MGPRVKSTDTSDDLWRPVTVKVFYIYKRPLFIIVDVTCVIKRKSPVSVLCSGITCIIKFLDLVYFSKVFSRCRVIY